MKALAVTHFPGVADRLPSASRKGPSLMRRVATWYRVSRDRRRLLELDDRLLADLGLTREQAAWEASRPFWDVNVDAYR